MTKARDLMLYNIFNTTVRVRNDSRCVFSAENTCFQKRYARATWTVCIKHGVLDLILCGGEAPRRQNSRSQSCELRVPVKSTKEWISSTEASLWVTWIKCRCWKGQFWQKSQTDTHCQNGSHSYRSKANQTKVCTDTMGQRATVSHFRDGWIWQENTGELELATQKCVRKQNFLN